MIIQLKTSCIEKLLKAAMPAITTISSMMVKPLSLLCFFVTRRLTHRCAFGWVWADCVSNVECGYRSKVGTQGYCYHSCYHAIILLWLAFHCYFLLLRFWILLATQASTAGMSYPSASLLSKVLRPHCESINFLSGAPRQWCVPQPNLLGDLKRSQMRY